MYKHIIIVAGEVGHAKLVTGEEAAIDYAKCMTMLDAKPRIVLDPLGAEVTRVNA